MRNISSNDVKELKKKSISNEKWKLILVDTVNSFQYRTPIFSSLYSKFYAYFKFKINENVLPEVI